MIGVRFLAGSFKQKHMVYPFYEAPIKEIEDILQEAGNERLDLTRDYRGNKNEKGFQLQCAMIRATRSMYWNYVLFNVHYSIDSMLEILRATNKILRKHPIHHVIEGRIAAIVQKSQERSKQIPAKFVEYLFFEFHPWNNPDVNYYSLDELVEKGRSDLVPPEYRHVETS